MVHLDFQGDVFYLEKNHMNLANSGGGLESLERFQFWQGKEDRKLHQKQSFPSQWDFQGPPTMGPPCGKLPIPFFRDSYGNSMGPAFHKGGPIIGGPWKSHWPSLTHRIHGTGILTDEFTIKDQLNV